MAESWDITDDEIRVIGKDPAPSSHASPGAGGGKGPRRTWTVALAVAAALAILSAVALLVPWRGADPGDDPGNGLFEGGGDSVSVSPVADVRDLLGNYVDTAAAYTEVLSRTVNDVPLTIYIPHGGTASLCLGAPDTSDRDIVLCAQAADIRRDNLKIVGAFVLAGEPLAWGLSKKGYCGIIDGKVSIGVAANSPLFEQATETGGYFFRQYPLVDNGVLVENEPKNKAMRKALCDRDGEVFVVKSESYESFHDFAQALVDLGVDQAIYLVGSSSYGFWRDVDGAATEFVERRTAKYEYENYIVWRADPRPEPVQ